MCRERNGSVVLRSTCPYKLYISVLEYDDLLEAVFGDIDASLLSRIAFKHHVSLLNQCRSNEKNVEDCVVSFSSLSRTIRVDHEL